MENTFLDSVMVVILLERITIIYHHTGQHPCDGSKNDHHYNPLCVFCKNM